MRYSELATWIRARLWIALAAGCAWLVWIGSLIYSGGTKDFSGNLVGADHLAFYHAARLIRDGESARIYNYDELRAEGYQQALIGWNWSDCFEAYRNPPFYALLYLSTAGLSFYASFVIWTGISFALLALAIRLLRPERPARVFLWSLTCFPVFATISFGQNTFISLAIFAGVYRLLSDERPFAAGLVAGLLWFKPQLLLGLCVWWGFQPRRYAPAWIGMGLTGCALTAISWLAVPDASRAFVETLRTNAGYAEFGPWNIVNPKAFFALLLPGVPLLPWILSGACSLASIAVAWNVKQRTGAPVAVMFPVAVFLSLWASPHALVYEWALLVAAAVVLWERFPDSRDAWLCLFALAWVALAITTPMAQRQFAAGLPLTLQIGVPVLGVVGWLVAHELMWSADAHERAPDGQSGEPVQTDPIPP
jgi:hypothetical protein